MSAIRARADTNRGGSTMSLRTVGKFAAELDDSSQPGDTQSWYDQLVRLVPGEAVTALVAGLGFCAGFGWGWGVRWTIFGVIALLSVIWIQFSYWQTLTPAQKQARFPITWWGIFMGEAAYVAWAVCIPETPFLQWHKWNLKFAPLVTFGAVLLLTAADMVHTMVKEHGKPKRDAHRAHVIPT
jgi:hypothetical protein